MPFTQDQLAAMNALLSGTFSNLNNTPQIQPGYTLNDIYGFGAVNGQGGWQPQTVPQLPPAPVPQTPPQRMQAQTNFPVVPATGPYANQPTPMDIQAAMRLPPSPPGYGPDNLGGIPKAMAYGMGQPLNTQGTGPLFPNGQQVAALGAINGAMPPPPRPRPQPPMGMTPPVAPMPQKPLQQVQGTMQPQQAAQPPAQPKPPEIWKAPSGRQYQVGQTFTVGRGDQNSPFITYGVTPNGIQKMFTYPTHDTIASGMIRRGAQNAVNQLTGQSGGGGGGLLAQLLGGGMNRPRPAAGGISAGGGGGGNGGYVDLSQLGAVANSLN